MTRDKTTNPGEIAAKLERLHADYERDGPQSISHTRLDRSYRNHHATIIAALRAAATIGEDHELLTELDQTKAEVERMREALGAAKQFIENGVELGYIRLPEPPDSALETLPMIRRALAGSATPTNQRDANNDR